MNKKEIKLKIKIVFDATYPIDLSFYEGMSEAEAVLAEATYIQRNPALMVELLKKKGFFKTTVDKI